MQKLELRNNLNEIIKKLKSETIIEIIGKPQIEKYSLLNLLIDSKSGYDQDQSNKEKSKIYDQFDTAKIYSTDNFTTLLSFVSTAPILQSNNVQQQNRIDRGVLLVNNSMNDFYSYHKTLVATYKLIDNLLLVERNIFNEQNVFDVNKAIDNGEVIFEIVSDENISLKTFKDIIESIEVLIENIYTLFEKIENDTFDIIPSISIIDSGSDINIGVKIPKKAANLLAQIIKEFWDLISNNKSYRHGKRLKDIETSITVLGKLKLAVDQGVIDPASAEIIRIGIIENTEKIIFNQTVTKQIVLETREYSNRQLVMDQSKRFLLENNISNEEKTNDSEKV